MKTTIITNLFVLLFVSLPVLAETSLKKYQDIISKEFLHAQFQFTKSDKVKYEKCKKKTYPTCIYIWGTETKRDASRVKYGLEPEGNKLQIVYAKAKSSKDFKRVLSTYTDAINIDDLASQSVWSKKKKQLSLITEDNLIIHVHLDDKNNNEPKKKAISIAHYILENL